MNYQLRAIGSPWRQPSSNVKKGWSPRASIGMRTTRVSLTVYSAHTLTLTPKLLESAENTV